MIYLEITFNKMTLVQEFAVITVPLKRYPTISDIKRKCISFYQIIFVNFYKFASFQYAGPSCIHSLNYSTCSLLHFCPFACVLQDLSKTAISKSKK